MTTNLFTAFASSFDNAAERPASRAHMPDRALVKPAPGKPTLVSLPALLDCICSVSFIF